MTNNDSTLEKTSINEETQELLAQQRRQKSSETRLAYRNMMNKRKIIFYLLWSLSAVWMVSPPVKEGVDRILNDYLNKNGAGELNLTLPNAKFTWKWAYEDVPLIKKNEQWILDLVWLQEGKLISIRETLWINNIKNQDEVFNMVSSISQMEDQLSKRIPQAIRFLTDSYTDKKLPIIKEFSKSALKVKTSFYESICSSEKEEDEFLAKLANFIIFNEGKTVYIWQFAWKSNIDEFIKDFKKWKISTKWPVWFAMWVLWLEKLHEKDSLAEYNQNDMYNPYLSSASFFFSQNPEYLKIKNAHNSKSVKVSSLKEEKEFIAYEIIWLENILKAVKKPKKVVKKHKSGVSKDKKIEISQKIAAKWVRINQIDLEIIALQWDLKKINNESNSLWNKIPTISKRFMSNLSENVFQNNDFISARLVSQYPTNILEARGNMYSQFYLNLTTINHNFEKNQSLPMLTIDWIKWKQMEERSSILSDKTRYSSPNSEIIWIINKLIFSNDPKNVLILRDCINISFETKYISLASFYWFLNQLEAKKKITSEKRQEIKTNFDKIYRSFLETWNKKEFNDLLLSFTDSKKFLSFFDNSISESYYNTFYTKYLVPNVISTISIMDKMRNFVPEIYSEWDFKQNISNTRARFIDCKWTEWLITDWMYWTSNKIQTNKKLISNNRSWIKRKKV